VATKVNAPCDGSGVLGGPKDLGLQPYRLRSDAHRWSGLMCFEKQIRPTGQQQRDNN